jgi:hypothetical protein
MVRHPHFAQPIFVRFPRPAVLRGRDGAERFPQAADVGLEAAVLRSLRTLDPSITLGFVQEFTALYDEAAVIRAKNAVLRERPRDVKGVFRRQFRAVVRGERAEGSAPRAVPALKTTPFDDPYGGGGG